MCYTSGFSLPPFLDAQIQNIYDFQNNNHIRNCFCCKFLTRVCFLENVKKKTNAEDKFISYSFKAVSLLQCCSRVQAIFLCCTTVKLMASFVKLFSFLWPKFFQFREQQKLWYTAVEFIVFMCSSCFRFRIKKYIKIWTIWTICQVHKQFRVEIFGR